MGWSTCWQYGTFYTWAIWATCEKLANLVEVFPSEERLVLLLAEVDGEGVRLGAFLPQSAGAVPGQRVVSHHVIVGVAAGQNAASARAAQWRDGELWQGTRSVDSTAWSGHRKWPGLKICWETCEKREGCVTQLKLKGGSQRHFSHTLSISPTKIITQNYNLVE